MRLVYNLVVSFLDLVFHRYVLLSDASRIIVFKLHVHTDMHTCIVMWAVFAEEYNVSGEFQ